MKLGKSDEASAKLPFPGIFLPVQSMGDITDPQFAVWDTPYPFRVGWNFTFSIPVCQRFLVVNDGKSHRIFPRKLEFWITEALIIP